MHYGGGGGGGGGGGDDAAAAAAAGVMDNTYFLYSSDHGYHLGQFRIPIEKMLPYVTRSVYVTRRTVGVG